MKLNIKTNTFEKRVVSEDDILLRIYVSENDKDNGRPLYETIVLTAHKLDLAGATVLRGVMGYGADKKMHSAKLLDLSDNMPVVIEIIDKEANIEKLLPLLQDLIKSGFATMEQVHTISYRT